MTNKQPRVMTDASYRAPPTRSQTVASFPLLRRTVRHQAPSHGAPFHAAMEGIRSGELQQRIGDLERDGFDLKLQNLYLTHKLSQAHTGGPNEQDSTEGQLRLLLTEQVEEQRKLVAEQRLMRAQHEESQRDLRRLSLENSAMKSTVAESSVVIEHRQQDERAHFHQQARRDRATIDAVRAAHQEVRVSAPVPRLW